MGRPDCLSVAVCRLDLLQLCKAHRIGSRGATMPVYRLYTQGTLEDRILQLTDQGRSMESVFSSMGSRWVL